MHESGKRPPQRCLGITLDLPVRGRRVRVKLLGGCWWQRLLAAHLLPSVLAERRGRAENPGEQVEHSAQGEAGVLGAGREWDRHVF